jgi:AraC-like DNA-binding protein
MLVAEAGAFHAELTVAKLPGLTLVQGEERLPRVLEASIAAQRLVFRLAPQQGRDAVLNGRLDPPGTLRVGSGGVPWAARSTGPFTWTISSIGHGDLALRLAALGVTTRLPLGDQGECFRPAPAALARFTWLRAAALGLARENPGVLAHPVAAAFLDMQLGEAHVAVQSDGVTEVDRAAQRRGHAIMLRVEDYLAEHLTEPVAVSALCAVARCSTKTLEVLFQERLGMTPCRYLRARRLALARERLLAPNARTVAEVALDCGFWELGRFAVAYRAAYGERPSETLGRSTR